MNPLAAAITAAESAQTALGSADSAQAAAQAKFDAAAAQKATADQDDATAVGAFNTALDGLIAAANAAKIVRAV